MSTKIDKVLALDTETSGINFEAMTVAEDYQMVSVGMIVADTENFEPMDELYIVIKWDGKSKWSEKAEEVHGMSKQYLAKNGVSPEEAAEKIALFLDKHFGIDKAINLLGHNVVHFDLQFLKQFLWKYGLPFKFAHRHFDTFSLSMGTVRAFDSNELFDMMGFEKRKSHNALDDAKMSLAAFRIISKMWKKYVN